MRGSPKGTTKMTTGTLGEGGHIAVARSERYKSEAHARVPFPMKFGASVRGFFFALSMLVVLCGGMPAGAEDLQRIAAVVNDQVISMYDLAGRTRLIIVSSGLQDTPEIRARLAPQILRTLIDETLELQEARRLNITVSTKEIEQVVGRIAQQNDMSLAQFDDFIKTSHIPLSAVTQQIRAGIAWSKIVAQKIRPTIEIGDDQVQEYLARLKADENKPQYRLAEIFLGVDSPQQDEDVRRTAERLADQVRQGANFAALARQFSQSATAAVGGDMGWIEQGSLQPELEKAVEQLKTGQVSDPVRTVAGYHIFLLRGIRQVGGASDNTELTLQHVFLPGPANAKPQDIQALRSVAQSIAETATSCADFPELLKELPDAKTILPEKIAVKDLSPTLRTAIANLAPGKISEPIVINNGILLVMVCSRSGDEGGLPTAEQARDILGREKLDLLMRRYLRDLRMAAYVDVRA